MSQSMSWPLVCARRGYFCQPNASHMIIVQARGTSEIASLEGRFTLRKGDWIAFEEDANVECLPGATGIAFAVCIPESCAPSLLSRFLSERGVLKGRSLVMGFRAWKVMRAKAVSPGRMDGDWRLRPLLDLLARGMAIRESVGSRQMSRKQASCRPRTLRRIRRGMLYLHGNSHRVVLSSEIADVCKCSPWHVSRMFQYVYGEGFREAGIRLRIEKACMLLGERDGLAIGEIARQCGFGDASSFARTFKLKVGVAASEYRSRCTHSPHLEKARFAEGRGAVW